MIKITLNGKSESLDKEMNVSEFLKLKRVRPEVVTVELNDNILDRKKFTSSMIKEGDRLEFVYFMGGGKNSEF